MLVRLAFWIQACAKKLIEAIQIIPPYRLDESIDWLSIDAFV